MIKEKDLPALYVLAKNSTTTLSLNDQFTVYINNY